jgi:phenylalanyl-tRNA synthetase beta chain
LGFEDAKGYVEYLCRKLGISESYSASEEFGLIPGRTGVITVGDERVGVLGQVHPQVTAAWDIEQDVYLFEIDLEALLPHVDGVKRYRQIHRFPPVVEDLAVIVDDTVPAARVKTAIESFSLVREAALFDIYTGTPVPTGKKSLAFSVTYQSADYTLTDAEVERERNRIVNRLQGELGAELRQ